ncbi:VWA domain-containing protein [Nocardia sp. NPDC058058]|uniref:vWA domain-containing protein n=1 Tax=Nocardia sp. NPDC058058 TaxID=3346317 RepID=UPI0036D9B9CC
MTIVESQLSKGQNVPIAVAEVTIALQTTAAADLSALLVTANGKVRSDADFVFFNQPAGPGVRLVPGTPGALHVALGQIPHDIDQIRAVLTLADPQATFGRYQPPIATLSDGAGKLLCEYRIDGLGPESVVIALELYRRGPGWKVRAVGQGYSGGFAALVTDHGVTVDDDPASSPSPASDAAAVDRGGVRTVAGEQKLSLEKRQKLDLRKREVAKVLLAKGAGGVRARVILVIDKTGSMSEMYKKQVVHRVVERMIPIAIQLDDDGELEPYLYGSRFAKLPNVRVDTAESWCAEFIHLGGVHGGIDYRLIGGANDEIPIMTEILNVLRPGGDPTLVLFFTDGGFHKRGPITALMRSAAEHPAFWQFIGLGHNDFGVLRKLDTLTGRKVDNAGFFAIDDIDRMSDADLYSKLLSEFPDWLRAARAAHVLP